MNKCSKGHIGIAWTAPGPCPLCASHAALDDVLDIVESERTEQERLFEATVDLTVRMICAENMATCNSLLRRMKALLEVEDEID